MADVEAASIDVCRKCHNYSRQVFRDRIAIQDKERMSRWTGQEIDLYRWS